VPARSRCGRRRGDRGHAGQRCQRCGQERSNVHDAQQYDTGRRRRPFTPCRERCGSWAGSPMTASRRACAPSPARVGPRVRRRALAGRARPGVHARHRRARRACARSRATSRWCRHRARRAGDVPRPGAGHGLPAGGPARRGIYVKEFVYRLEEAVLQVLAGLRIRDRSTAWARRRRASMCAWPTHSITRRCPRHLARRRPLRGPGQGGAALGIKVLVLRGRGHCSFHGAGAECGHGPGAVHPHRPLWLRGPALRWTCARRESACSGRGSPAAAAPRPGRPRRAA
jgi:hypothetical protein